MSLATATTSVFVSADCFAVVALPAPPPNVAIETAVAITRTRPAPMNLVFLPVRCTLLMCPPLVRFTDLPLSVLRNNVQLAREPAEGLAALCGHTDDLLEANAELAGQVDPRFDAVNHPLPQRDLLAAH